MGLLLLCVCVFLANKPLMSLFFFFLDYLVHWHLKWLLTGMCLLSYYFLFSGVSVVIFCSFLLLVSPLLIWWFSSVLVWVLFSLFSCICIYYRVLTCSYHKIHIYWPISILVLNRYDLFFKGLSFTKSLVLIFLAENRCVPNQHST